MRKVISDDFIVFFQENKDDLDWWKKNWSINFHQTMQINNFKEWIDVIQKEIKFISNNDVWELIPLSKGAKFIGCNLIFKTKRDSNGDMERHEAHLVANGFTQKEGTDIKETFSPISMKDSFRTILSFVTHFDIKLRQMVYKLNKSKYGLSWFPIMVPQILSNNYFIWFWDEFSW